MGVAGPCKQHRQSTDGTTPRKQSPHENEVPTTMKSCTVCAPRTLPMHNTGGRRPSPLLNGGARGCGWAGKTQAGPQRTGRAPTAPNHHAKRGAPKPTHTGQKPMHRLPLTLPPARRAHDGIQMPVGHPKPPKTCLQEGGLLLPRLGGGQGDGGRRKGRRAYLPITPYMPIHAIHAIHPRQLRVTLQRPSKGMYRRHSPWGEGGARDAVGAPKT
jgi:hypothetical protein